MNLRGFRDFEKLRIWMWNSVWFDVDFWNRGVYVLCVWKEVENSYRILVLMSDADLGELGKNFVTGSWNEELRFWFFAQWGEGPLSEGGKIGDRVSHGRGHGRVLYWNCVRWATKLFAERTEEKLASLRDECLRWANWSEFCCLLSDQVVCWAKGENVVLVLRCRIVENEVEWLIMVGISEYLRC